MRPGVVGVAVVSWSGGFHRIDKIDACGLAWYTFNEITTTPHTGHRTTVFNISHRVPLYNMSFVSRFKPFPPSITDHLIYIVQT